MSWQPSHKPALVSEVVELLNLAPGKLIADCTIGAGGHAEAILARITPGGLLLGVDRDREALSVAEARLKDYKGSFKLIHANFRNIKEILKDEYAGKVDGILFDLGISSLQLDEPSRGFSFARRGPLDMRMDKSGGETASDMANELSEEELVNILRGLGEERFAKRIGRAIVNAREKGPIDTTEQLRDIVIRALPSRLRYGRIDPATRTFQALRIAVNDELNALREALADVPGCLGISGRACVLSFHSLEDRIAKNSFREFAKQGIMRLVNKKPIRPSLEEARDNPRARSAKLRAAERIL